MDAKPAPVYFSNMNVASIKTYGANCFLLTIPVLIWNLLLTEKLPEAYQPDVFWRDIPAWVTYGETSSRIIVFVLALLMPLRITSGVQKSGLLLYTAGLLVYFASWLPLIYFPTSRWSHSMAGFMAPAYTPLFWLTAIALIGDSFFINVSFRRWYFLLSSALFILFHAAHTYLIYSRLHG